MTFVEAKTQVFIALMGMHLEKALGINPQKTFKQDCEKLLSEAIEVMLEEQREACENEALYVLTEEMNTIDEARNLGFRGRVSRAILNAEVQN